MENRERLAFRILASLFPDYKPSEVRKVIEEALEKEECQDDVELWMAIVGGKAEKSEEPKEKVVERIIEHHYTYPWYVNYESIPCSSEEHKITCESTSGRTPSAWL